MGNHKQKFTDKTSSKSALEALILLIISATSLPEKERNQLNRKLYLCPSVAFLTTYCNLKILRVVDHWSEYIYKLEL